jgi:hypothetical protein
MQLSERWCLHEVSQWASWHVMMPEASLAMAEESI